MRLRIFAALLVGGATAASAAQYPLTDAEAQMFGDIETITAHGEDTLPDLARRYGLGYEEILRANPGVDTWLPGEGTTIVIPGPAPAAAEHPRRHRGQSTRASPLLLPEAEEGRDAAGHHLSR